jgi:homoserine O-acetyltransferase
MDRAELASQGRQAVEGQNPARNIADRFAVEKLLNERGLARARTTDANSFLYTVRANQLYLNEYPNLQAALAHAPRRWLVVAGPHNPLAPAEGMRELTETLGKAGKAVQTMGLPEAPGSTGMAPLGNRIRAFLGG